MKEQFIRTGMLLGEDGIDKLSRKRVAVFGIGGVGGHTVEALVRSGIGSIDIIDNDVISVSNINRQIIATYDTVGKPKTQVMKERIESINPECKVITHNRFYLPECRNEFPFSEYDYIVDAIDTVTAKIDLAVIAQQLDIPMISSMGTGNKLDPTQLEVTDIYKTSVCPLAKVMRKELKARDIKKLTVVYSKETVLSPKVVEIEQEKTEQVENNEHFGNARKVVPGSTAFVPAVAGLIIAGEVIRKLVQ